MPESDIPGQSRSYGKQAWEALLGPEELAVLERFGAGRRVGFGTAPAVVVIDAQNYMVGNPGRSDVVYPSACGPMAEEALAVLRVLLTEARRQQILVVYTKYEVRRDGLDMGVYRMKRGFPATEGWCLEGSEGAEIAPAVAPETGDVVLVKKRPSAFWGTPLLGLLIAHNIDTLIVAGGSTSNCVRATAVDAMSYGYRTIVVEDCVFDRLGLCHAVSLFDLDRQYADVLDSGTVMAYMRAVNGPSQGLPANDEGNDSIARP
jgi:maleamate amidohydrolase